MNGRFDPDTPSADNLDNQRKGYATLSAGLFYRIEDIMGKEKAFIGVAIFNANRPNISLLDNANANLPLSTKLTAGYRVYQGQKFSVLPTLRLINQADNNFLNLGSRLDYELVNNREGVKKIELGLWYNTNGLCVFSMAYEQSNLTVGVSYDVPVADKLSTGQNGIFELAVSYKLKK